MSIEANFLGRGWGFPPEFSSQGVVMTAGVEDIERSLDILLTTRLRERILSPEYGCDLSDFVFESINTTLRTQIKELVKTAILYHEPRIDPLNVTLEQLLDSLGTLVITVEFRVRATNTRYNYVFPFYKAEGSELFIDLEIRNKISKSLKNE